MLKNIPLIGKMPLFGQVNRFKNYQVVLQQSEEDCGAACLASIAKFYGQNFTISRLRECAGTGQKGTSLLGLKQVRNIPEVVQHYPKYLSVVKRGSRN
ncbi:cysteine peptidase family C39 domain-containing protein [Microcoleus sp. B5-D4]|uniref:cysteine peptidase family C39 domain-containing protein n=1 Tax=unclassified Microcoleus TaxID=2642155 RepID=UPI002FCF3598